MAELRVKSIMSRDLIKVEYGDTIEKASMQLVKHRVSSVLVSRNGDMVGIITETDILNRVLAKNKKPSEILVQEVMSSPIETISENATLEEAAAKMRNNKLKKLLAVKGDKPVGILTIADLAKKTATVQRQKFDGWAKGIVDAWNAF